MTLAVKRQAAIDFAASTGCKYILERIYSGPYQSKSLIQPVATYSDGQDLALQIYDDEWDLECVLSDDTFLHILASPPEFAETGRRPFSFAFITFRSTMYPQTTEDDPLVGTPVPDRRDYDRCRDNGGDVGRPVTG
jgi:hypothetical protein